MMKHISVTQTKDVDKELASIEFGREIERLRKLRGFETQKAFAESVKIDKSIISDIEGGKTNPSLTVIKKLADILEVSPYSLISVYYGIPVPGFDPNENEVLTTIRNLILTYYGLQNPTPATEKPPRPLLPFTPNKQAKDIVPEIDQQVKDANPNPFPIDIPEEQESN